MRSARLPSPGYPCVKHPVGFSLIFFILFFLNEVAVTLIQHSYLFFSFVLDTVDVGKSQPRQFFNPVVGLEEGATNLKQSHRFR